MDNCNKRIRGNQTQHLHLPEDIIGEILVRLPVKSLLRFSCVSKSWASLISGERFIKTHLGNSRENTTLANHSVIFNERYIYGREPLTMQVKQYSLLSLVKNSMEEADANPSPIELSNLIGFVIVGCCNGLVCIMDRIRHRLYLWNPSIRILAELPKVFLMQRVVRYGFGWDSCSDAYKVFLFLKDIVKCKIYSSRTKTWRTVEHSHSEWQCFRRCEKGEFVGGKLHWQKDIKGKPGQKDVVKIATMDLRSEECGMMDYPFPCDYRRGSKRFHLSLGVIEGCLSVLRTRRKRESIQFDIWVMKEYGVKESWFKLSCIPLCMSLVGTGVLNRNCWIPSRPNEEILIGSGGIFYFYNPNKKATLELDIQRRFRGYVGHGYLCFESLVSPKRILEC